MKWKYWLLLAGVLTAASVAASVAFAGPVRGRISLSEAPAAPEGEHYWSVWNGFLAAPSPTPDASRQVAIVLTQAGASGEVIGCTPRIEGGDFAPKVIPIRPGSALRIENTDGCSHELFSEAIPEFTAIATAPGNARSGVVVPAGGPYEIRDRLYEHVSADVFVIDGLVACGSAQPDGTFLFESVPPGEYTLAVYGAEGKLHEAPIAVTSDSPLEVEAISLSGAAGGH